MPKEEADFYGHADGVVEKGGRVANRSSSEMKTFRPRIWVSRTRGRGVHLLLKELRGGKSTSSGWMGGEVL